MRHNHMKAQAAAGLVVLVLGALLLWAPPALAQANDDPYGPTTTTTRPPGPKPACSLRDRAGAPGDVATVQMRTVPRGATVEVRFDGEVVASQPADGPGEAPWVTMDIDFVVPEREPGFYSVTASGADFSVECRTRNGERFEVLASGSSPGEPDRVQGVNVLPGSGAPGGPADAADQASGVGPTDADSVGGERTRRGGLLPRTGAALALLAGIGAALLVAGRLLRVTGARRRTTRVQRATPEGQRFEVLASGGSPGEPQGGSADAADQASGIGPTDADGSDGERTRAGGGASRTGAAPVLLAGLGVALLVGRRLLRVTGARRRSFPSL